MTTATQTASIEKSKGHLGFHFGKEYFEVGNYVASAQTFKPVMTNGRRFGRFECYLSTWEQLEAHLIYLASKESRESGENPGEVA